MHVNALMQKFMHEDMRTEKSPLNGGPQGLNGRHKKTRTRRA
jgi:hypothetical protein